MVPTDMPDITIVECSNVYCTSIRTSYMWCVLCVVGLKLQKIYLYILYFLLQVLQFQTNCPECNAPAATNMKLVRILYS